MFIIAMATVGPIGGIKLSGNAVLLSAGSLTTIRPFRSISDCEKSPALSSAVGKSTADQAGFLELVLSTE